MPPRRLRIAELLLQPRELDVSGDSRLDRHGRKGKLLYVGCVSREAA